VSVHYATDLAAVSPADREIGPGTIAMLAYCTTAFASTRLAVGELDAARARHRRDLMLQAIRNERAAALLTP